METFTNVNEEGKYPSLVEIFGGQYFRVPLQSENERVAGTLDPFDQSVFRDCIYNQSLAESVYGLVMGCVDL